MSGITFVRRPDLSADKVDPAGGNPGPGARRTWSGWPSTATSCAAAASTSSAGSCSTVRPGTGKTHTVRHLIGAVPDTTVVLLSGTQMAFVSQAAQIARAHQPAIVVLEDCDLIAEDRDHGHVGGGPSPLLFTLLDAMDGLDADADVVFLLTTNRAEALERALAQRPGRVDLAVEIPLPDEAARRALIGLYADGRRLLPEVVAAQAATAAAGTTASYAKELVRRAVLRGRDRGAGPRGRRPGRRHRLRCSTTARR